MRARWSTPWVCAALLATALGCANVEDPESMQTDDVAATDAAGEEDDVLVAARIADEIEADPSREDEILAQHEMTAEEYEELMWEIAADPEKSRRFLEARGAGNR